MYVSFIQNDTVRYVINNNDELSSTVCKKITWRKHNLVKSFQSDVDVKYESHFIKHSAQDEMREEMIGLVPGKCK